MPTQETVKTNYRNRLVWGSVCSIIILTGLLLGLHFVLNYRQEIRLLEERLLAQARVVDENLNANLTTINLILENIKQEWETASGKDYKQLSTYMNKQNHLFTGVKNSLVLDHTGQCIAASNNMLIGQTFSQRDYFTIPRDTSDKNQLFLSPPFKSTLNAFVINISKPILGKNGEFKGIIAVSLSPDYFQALLQSTIYAPDNRIALVHAGGTVFSAAPASAHSVIGHSINHSDSPFQQHLFGNTLSSIQAGRSTITGDARIHAFITNKPKKLHLNKQLVVAASRNLDSVLADWKRITQIQLVFYLLFSSAALFITRIMLQHQNQLDRSTAFNRALLDSIQAHIAILDQNGVIVSINDAWKKFANNNRTATNALARTMDVGSNYIEVCRESVADHSEQAADALEGIMAVLNGSAPSFYLEYPCHAPDMQRWFSMTVEPLRMPEGGAVVTHTNITKQKLIEHDLQESQQQFANIIELLPDATFVVDNNMRVIAWNKAIEEMSGVSKFELLGLGDSAYTVPFYGDRRKQLLDLLTISDDELAAHYKNIHRTGETLSAEVFCPALYNGKGAYLWATGSPLYNLNGERIGAIEIIRDISERKQTEQRLIASKRFLKTTADVLPGMVGYWNKELRCTFANIQLLQWFDKTPEEMIGIQMQQLVGDQQFGRNLVYIRATLQGRPQHFERIVTRLNGTKAHTWSHYIPDCIDGAVQGFYMLVTDITELKQTERKLEQLNRELHLRTAQAEAATRAKGTFLATMSHEIRTPMNAITGLSYLALQTDLDQQQQDYLQKIHSSANALLGIINDILDFSKIEAGRLTIETIDFQLDTVLNNLIEMVSFKAAEKNLQLYLQVDPRIPLDLQGDPLRLSQVLLNLLGNALKFTDQGDVCIKTALMNHPPEKVTLQFSIEDTGIGISEEQLQQLFQPFTQADGSISRRYGGTGLGLVITSQLVELMGGRIEVTSTPRQGSRFMVTLPFGVQPASRTGARDLHTAKRNDLLAPVAVPVFDRLRVLVVEDNQINQQVARELLEKTGLQVEVADSGKKAVEKLQDGNRFNLILMDLQMPEMDGFEATRQIRRQYSAELLPIIAMTAHALPEERNKCLANGMNDHVSKPIAPDLLYKTVAKWLSGATDTAANQPESQPTKTLRHDNHLPAELPGFNVTDAVSRLMGNSELLQKLISLFCVENCNDVKVIRQALAQRNNSQALERLHSLKGIAGNIGAEVVARQAQLLEKQLSEHRLDNIPALLDDLDNAMQQVLASGRSVIP